MLHVDIYPVSVYLLSNNSGLSFQKKSHPIPKSFKLLYWGIWGNANGNGNFNIQYTIIVITRKQKQFKVVVEHNKDEEAKRERGGSRQ